MKFQHRAESKLSKFSKLASSIAIGLAIWGCNADTAASKLQAASQKPVVELETPSPPTRESLALNSGDEEARVGDIEADVWESYPRPKKANEYLTESIPVESDGLKAKYWEKDGHTFALLHKAGRIVLALESFEPAKLDQKDELVSRFTRRYGSPKATLSPLVEFYHWVRDNDTLMVCWTTDSERKNSIATAVGSNEIMKALRMDQDSAALDSTKANKILTEVFEPKRN